MFEEVKSGESARSLSGIFAWLSPAGEAMLAKTAHSPVRLADSRSRRLRSR